MARPDLEDSTTNRDKWNNAVDWNNPAGDWWDKDATAQGATPWAFAAVTDTDEGKTITFDVTEWAQAVYDNPDHTSALLVRRVSGGGNIHVAALGYATSGNRPKIAYDGGAEQTATDCVSIALGSAGGSTGATLEFDTDSSSLLVEFPEPASRPTSATMTLYTTAQFGGATLNAFWLRYPSESAPTLGSSGPAMAVLAHHYRQLGVM